MKINILYRFRDTPWGGANQFLKALRNYFRENGCYEEEAGRADVLLFISYPFNSEGFFSLARRLKKRKDIIVVNRMNGPISLYRGRDIEVDRMNFCFNGGAADGTVYQSEWSRRECFRLGMKENRYEAVIHNAVDPDIFFPPLERMKGSGERKIRLVAVSWSNNQKKGFDVYRHLDEHLDLSRYEMTFIGNAPFEFKNIRHISPLPSEELAAALRGHDIFIFASMLETCSNSLLEAIHCGLPVVARNNSSQPEIVGEGGRLFEGPEDVISAVDSVAGEIERYRRAVKAPDINEIGRAYHDFCRRIYDDMRSGGYIAKKWSYADYIKLWSGVLWWKYGLGMKDKVKNLIRPS